MYEPCYYMYDVNNTYVCLHVTNTYIAVVCMNLASSCSDHHIVPASISYSNCTHMLNKEMLLYLECMLMYSLFNT